MMRDFDNFRIPNYFLESRKVAIFHVRKILSIIFSVNEKYGNAFTAFMSQYAVERLGTLVGESIKPHLVPLGRTFRGNDEISRSSGKGP